MKLEDINYANGEFFSVDEWINKAIAVRSRHFIYIYAMKLTRPIIIKRGNLGERRVQAGNWLVQTTSDPRNLTILSDEIFTKTYEAEKQ